MGRAGFEPATLGLKSPALPGRYGPAASESGDLSSDSATRTSSLRPRSPATVTTSGPAPPTTGRCSRRSRARPASPGARPWRGRSALGRAPHRARADTGSPQADGVSPSAARHHEELVQTPPVPDRDRDVLLKTGFRRPARRRSRASASRLPPRRARSPTEPPRRHERCASERGCEASSTERAGRPMS